MLIEMSNQTLSFDIQKSKCSLSLSYYQTTIQANSIDQVLHVTHQPPRRLRNEEQTKKLQYTWNDS